MTNRQAAAKVGRIAAKKSLDLRTDKACESIAGSALSQRALTDRRTSAKVARIAGKMLRDR